MVITGISKVQMSEDNFLHELISIVVLWLRTTEAVSGSKAALKRFWIWAKLKIEVPLCVRNSLSPH